MDEVRNSLYGRTSDGRNEWVLRDYEVLGVLLQPPYEVRAVGEYATSKEILDAFADQPLYTLRREGLLRVDLDLGPSRHVSIAELYEANPLNL